MAQLAIATYQPKTGSKGDLAPLVARWVRMLRELGFATAQAELIGRTKRGEVVCAFEWTSHDAIAHASEHPRIRELARAIEELADVVPFATLAESGERQPHFESLDHQAGSKWHVHTMVAR